MNSPFRNKLLIVHRWTGLTMGLVMAFLAVTGACSCCGRASTSSSTRDLHEVPACSQRLPLDFLAGIARGVHPGAKLHSIEVSTADTSSIAVKFTDKDYVYPQSLQRRGARSAEPIRRPVRAGGFAAPVSLHGRVGRLFAGWDNSASWCCW